MDLNTVSQMLGVIVQSYAGILAIGGAFFILFIQISQSRIQNIKTRIIEKVEYLTIYMSGVVYNPQKPNFQMLYLFRNEVLERDVSFREWLNRYVSESHKHAFFNNYKNRISEIEKLLKDRKSLSERKTPTKWFQLFFMISSIVFSYNITLLYVLSTGYVFKDWWYFIAYILAVIGLSPIGIFAWKIGSLLRELG